MKTKIKTMKTKMKKSTKLDIFKGVFFMSIILANVLATKIGSFFGFFMDIGILVYPLTYLMTDLISECWGKEQANRTVRIGFFLSLSTVLITLLAVSIGAAPFADATGFNTLFLAVPRIVLASMIAFLISQSIDVNLFHWIKKKTNGKHLWIRNNGSTMISQLFDSVIFTTIAFLGVFPPGALLAMIGVQYVAKFIIAAADTPFVYLGRRWVDGKGTK